ncbi:PPC16 [Symbiodinium sp. KB8]|nr:PPC16 [Symbiodinium sp. KB8]
MYPGEVSPGGRSGRSHFSDADMSPVGRRGEKLHTLRSTGGFSTRPMSRIQSAPLLHAQQSPSVTTWYTNASQSTFGSPSNRRSWQPLASSFREWDEIRNMGVRDPTDKRDFANGLVPNWSKDNTMRMQGMLEHVLSWTYYHIQRDEEHPQRKEVGEYLDPQNVPVALRSGAARFKFWCDLKPPFQVVQVTRAEEALGKWREAVESEGVKPHPDGELFYVTYECPLAYHVERAWGLKTMAGTFDNKVHGVASIRVPLDFPDKSRCVIASWGTPVVNWNPNDDKDPIVEPPTSIDPKIWMPIADELQQRPTIKRLAACRVETRIASRRADEKRKRGIEVPEMTRILLGPNPSLPRLAAAEQRHVTEADKGSSTSPTKRGIRKHCVCTSSSGFVHYAG